MTPVRRLFSVLLLVLALLASAGPVLAQNFRADDTQPVRATGFRQKDLVTLLKAMRNRVFGTAAVNGASLSVATTVAQVRTNGAIQYMIDGSLLTKASTDNFCTLSGTALTATTASYFRFEIDAAGACAATQGPVAAVASGTVNGAVPIPSRSASKATMGLLLVGGIAFTPGTTTTAADANRVYTNGDPDLLDLLEK